MSCVLRCIASLPSFLQRHLCCLQRSSPQFCYHFQQLRPRKSPSASRGGSPLSVRLRRYHLHPAGEKKLRHLILNCPEWLSRESREELAAHLTRKGGGDPSLVAALRAKDPTVSAAPRARIRNATHPQLLRTRVRPRGFSVMNSCYTSCPLS